MSMAQTKGFVAIHIGAGYHSPANCELYKQVCRQACLQAVAVLRDKGSALDAVTAAVVALEDSQWTNAGLGSNLTLDGTVECDASIMDGQSLHYGAVGAVSGVKNPVLVADSLLRTQMQGEMSLGRIPPSTLVAHGAYEWATRHDLHTISKDDLITESSRKAYIKNKRKLDMLTEGANCINCKVRRNDHMTSVNDQVAVNGTDADLLQDTVGAVCVDDSGNVASAVSSGGIILKQPGRLGQAALFGCGCWAENDHKGKVGVGVSTSGCGEQLTKTMLARECADCVKRQQDTTSALLGCFKHKFLESPLMRDEKQPLGGAVVVTVDSSRTNRLDVEVLWAHTTDSMCLGYMSTADQQAKAFVSRLPEGYRAGSHITIQSKTVAVNGAT